MVNFLRFRQIRPWAEKYRSWWIPAALAVIGTALFFGGIANYKKRLGYGMDLRPVLVVRTGLDQGHMLNEKDLEIRSYPKQFLPVGALGGSEADKVIGRSLVRPVAKGEILLWAVLDVTYGPSGPSARVAKGYRALAVPTDEIASVGRMIRAGDRIDVVTSVPLGENGGPTSLTLLQNVAVLSVGENSSTMTLMVLPKEVTLFTFALQHGKLMFVLRNPEDYQTPRDLPAVSMAQLIETGFRNSIQKERDDSIEIIRGGKLTLEQSLIP